MTAVTFLMAGTVRADQLGQTQAQLDQTNQQAAQVQAQLQQKQDEARSLQDALAGLDNQVAAVQASIDDTNTKIADMNAQIADVQAKMAAKKAILAQYIRSDYFTSSESTLEMLLGSGSLAGYMDQKEYLAVSQNKINAVLAEIEAIKRQLDGKKADLDKLNDQLAQQKQALQAEIDKKNQLLAQTQGEEANYQQLLANAQAARARLIAVIYQLQGNGPMVSRGHVEAGQVIGREGSTGNSTGAHLHFSIYVNHQPANPYDYVNAGKVSWPLAGFEVSQGFGCTSYVFEAPDSNCPGGHFHDGVDLVGSYGAPVHAAAAGEIIMNGWQPAGFGHYIVIDHGGFWTLYGHLQP